MDCRTHLLRVISLAALCLPACAAPDGKAVYQKHCAGCHEAALPRVPNRDTLQQLSPQVIVKALESGAMRKQGAELAPDERRVVAEFLTGKALGTEAQSSPPGGMCNSNQAFSDAPASPQWNGWGADLANRRFQSAAAAGLSAADVPHLKLKWAFGFPEGLAAFAQPTVVGGRVFVGSLSGKVYALDAKKGCTYWSFQASGPVRSAITVAQLGSAEKPRYAAFFGDLHANLYAVNAATGELIWKTPVDNHPLARITGAPQFYEGSLYVPVASLEETVGNAGEVCCTFRGSVVAVEAASGSRLWRSYTISEPAHPTRKNAAGTQLWGPSGVAVWSAPTLDRERKMIYVGTGDNYSDPATDTSDAILALDLDSGKLKWKRQFVSTDAWNIGCLLADKANCPEANGPDFDFGCSPVLVALPGGKSVLIAAQKSGVVHALDPDQQGQVLWEKRIAKGGALGGVEWGVAADDQKVYVPVSDVGLSLASDAKFELGKSKLVYDPRTGGGIFALRLSDGKQVWYSPPAEAACSGHERCSPAQSAAASVIPGVVFSGSVDGHLRAYSTEDGRVTWDYDTERDYATVNGVKANGGSIDGPGSTIVDGILYSESGYGFWGGTAGNVLLAFSVGGK
jgi:polyvinyl alcohol dehydrogenase (cytochrome)